MSLELVLCGLRSGIVFSSFILTFSCASQVLPAFAAHPSLCAVDCSRHLGSPNLGFLEWWRGRDEGSLMLSWGQQGLRAWLLPTAFLLLTATTISDPYTDLSQSQAYNLQDHETNQQAEIWANHRFTLGPITSLLLLYKQNFPYTSPVCCCIGPVKIKTHSDGPVNLLMIYFLPCVNLLRNIVVNCWWRAVTEKQTAESPKDLQHKLASEGCVDCDRDQWLAVSTNVIQQRCHSVSSGLLVQWYLANSWLF